MIKSFTLSSFFLLLTALPLWAQQQTLHDPMAHRNHLGFNTQTVLKQFFDQDRRTPLEMMYKRQMTPSGAVRLGTRLHYHRDDTHNTLFGNAPGFMRLVNTEWRAAIGVGYEWQRSLASWWLWYYGADTYFLFQKRVNTAYNAQGVFVEGVTQSRAIANSKHYFNTFGASVEPLAGIRFQITPRLYTSLEAKALLVFTNVLQGRYLQYVFIDGDVENTFGLDEWYRTPSDNRKNFDLNFQPNSGLSVFYVF